MLHDSVALFRITYSISPSREAQINACIPEQDDKRTVRKRTSGIKLLLLFFLRKNIKSIGGTEDVIVN